jgi:hypothetical protein
MKVKVVKKFRDKYTKKIHEVGEEIEVTKERYEEINSTAHGILVKEIPEKKTKSTRK